MRIQIRYVLAVLLTVGVCFQPNSADAQFGKLKDKVKKKVEKKTEEKIDKKIDETVDDAFEAVENQGDGGSTKESSDSDAPKSNERDEQASEAAKSRTTESKTASGGVGATAGASLKPGEGAWSNYDFVPGDEVIYFEDFEKCPIGDFPERLEFEKGNMETVEWQGSRYLRMPTHSDLNIPLPMTLPERFTIEFDLYLPGGIFRMFGPAPDRSGYNSHSFVEIGHGKAGVQGSGGGQSRTGLPKGTFDEIVHCRIMGYKKYLKVYINDTRVANVPNADFIRTNRIHINLYNFSEEKVLIDNIRVAEGGKKILYDALMADGRVATRGIYFDSGSDRLRPESTPTLKQMGAMLQDHDDLRLLIEGHTDNTGNDESNQELSDRRAAAVRAFLVATYKIDGSRLEAKGFGESNPVSPNSSPEGRQNNRRVELVKL